VGITNIEARARFDDDALDASGTFQLHGGDRADAKLPLEESQAPRPRLAPDAPLEFARPATSRRCRSCSRGSEAPSSSAERASMSRGAARKQSLRGVVGETRVDAPRYGVHHTNGRQARARRTGASPSTSHIGRG
jgi:hypothetical protein